MKKESVKRAEAREQVKHRAAQVAATVGLAGAGTAAFAATVGGDETPEDVAEPENVEAPVNAAAPAQPANAPAAANANAAAAAAPAAPAPERPNQAAAPEVQAAAASEPQAVGAQAHVDAISSAVGNSEPVEDLPEIDVDLENDESAVFAEPDGVESVVLPEPEVVEFTPAVEADDEVIDAMYESDEIQYDEIDFSLPVSEGIDACDTPDIDDPGISITGDL